MGSSGNSRCVLPSSTDKIATRQRFEGSRIWHTTCLPSGEIAGCRACWSSRRIGVPPSAGIFQIEETFEAQEVKATHFPSGETSGSDS
jgi:hypothetical protein